MTAAQRTLHSWAPVGFGLTVLAAIGLVLEGLLLAGALNRYIIPLPSEVLGSFQRIIVEEDILGKLLITCRECLYAMTLVATVGILVGALLYRVEVLRQACETWIAAMASAPIVLMYPLFLVIFGRSATTIITMGFIAGLPPVILTTIEGLSSTRRVLINVGKSFNLSPWQTFSKILFPAAMPTIFVGLRLGLIFCLINIVGVEFLINLGGLGQAINEFAERYDLGGTYAAICFVILTSVIFFVATERIERWLRPQD